jgi:hypothetical protein
MERKMEKGPENRWLVLAVLASSLLVVALDATILNVALPTLAADLAPSSTELCGSSTPTGSSSRACSSRCRASAIGSAAAGSS